jgi:hypothetical protein
MAEDPRPGPAPPQGRPAIGARLAMGFLAVVRMALIFPAIASLIAVVIMIFTVCFFEEEVWISVGRILFTLGFAELMIATAAGAKYLRDGILCRYESPTSRASDPLAACSHEAVLMIEVVLTVSGLALLLWIPAEISRMRNMGVLWPLSWAIIGGAAFWARHIVLKWIGHRSPIPDTDPCSTPGTPPSGEP